MKNQNKMPIGGGVKKILYALQTIKRIGLLDSTKALTTNNTCKACGLGMGGQQGGMTNELGEFPAVCNKSIQAQSTDIQAPIPVEVFDYTLDDFRILAPQELEHLGRLGNPIYKAKGADKFTVVDWSWALSHAAKRFKEIKPTKSFFYSSGRSSNEAGFVFQLFARLFGSNNVNNCSFYCHQATSVGLSASIGTGTATVELADLDLSDLIFVIGANPASNHPRFIHKLKACRDRGGHVVIINPAKEAGLVKFALPKSPRSLLKGGSEIASHYLQPKIASDLMLFQGIAKALIEKGGVADDFIEKYTQGFDDYRDGIISLTWADVELATGVKRALIESVADVYLQSSNAVFSWGMGMTHHRHGVENVEGISNLALLGGMIGRPGAGLLPLRGHSNVQGIGTIGVKPVLSEDVYQALQDTLGVRLPSTKVGEAMDTLACLEAAEKGDIDAALIMGGNLYAASPNTAWTEQAMDAIGFKLFLTTTLNAGHVNACDNSESLILPVMARDEETQATSQESMFNFIRLSDGGIKRIAQARSEVSVLVDLFADVLDKQPQIGDLDIRSFSSHNTIRQAISATIPGLEQLRDIGVAKREFHISNRLKHTPTFSTSSGKANFITHSVTQAMVQVDYPFTLMSVRSEGQFNSIIYEQDDSYRNVDQRWSVLMNVQDMEQLGVSRLDCVDIESAFGTMKEVHVYPYDVPRGNVMAYYPEANVLIGLERDPRSQTPAFKSVNVALISS